MHLIQVHTSKDEKAFLDFPRRLYRNDPNHVVMFDSEVRSAFDRKINPYFKHGDAVRWIARNEHGETVGRIAAFYDSSRDEVDYVRSGGCGFFDGMSNT